EVVGQLDGVCDGPVEGEGGGGLKRRVGFPRPALIPDNDDEIVLQRLEGGPAVANVAISWATCEVEQYRVVHAVTADRDPLVVLAEPDGRQLGDTARRRFTVRSQNRRCAPRPDEGGREDDQCRRKQR